MSWVVSPLLGETTLRAFYLSALWQIYGPYISSSGSRNADFLTPLEGAGLIVLSMGYGILTHSSVL
jgi:hypothetical protein